MGSTTRWGAGPEGRRIADLGDGTYLNPVLAGDFPDPSVLKDGEDYYLTYSSFDAAPGLLIYHSRDLVNWTPIGAALPSPIGDGLRGRHRASTTAATSSTSRSSRRRGRTDFGGAADLRHPRRRHERAVERADRPRHHRLPSTRATSSARTAGATCSSAASAASG